MFHPASNGCAERAVRSAKEALKNMGPGSWQERVDEYLLVQHTIPSQSTNKSPAEILMGRKLKTTLDYLNPQYTPRKPLDSGSTHRSFHVKDIVYARNYGRYPLWLPGRIVSVTRLVCTGWIWVRAGCGDNIKIS